MKQGLPIILSTAALGVAVLGATPIGEAARELAIPRASVGTPQLKKGAVTTPKLRNGVVTRRKLRENAVTSINVLDRSLLAEDFKAGQVPAGPKGDKGDPGIAGLELVSASSEFDSSPEKTVLVSCPESKRLIGGGAAVWRSAMRGVPVGVVLSVSKPLDNRMWYAIAHEAVTTDEGWFLQVTATCAAVN